MKHISTFIIVLFALHVQTILAVTGAPTVKVTAIIVPGATATEALLATKGPTVALAVSGCNLMSNFGTAMSFQFLSGTTPVEVSNFSFDSATFSLVRYHSGTTTTVLTNVPYGSYNYGSTGNPYLVARNAAGTQISSSGAIVGTTLQSVSRFLMLQQGITFNGTSRPVMTTVGDYYEFQWNLVGHYTYNSVQYSFPSTLNPLKAKIQVFPNLETFVPDASPSTWSSIGLYATIDLVNWFPVPGVTITSPLTTSVSGMIALADGKTIPGISPVAQSKDLFLRWKQPE